MLYRKGMKIKPARSGSAAEALIYPILLILILWAVWFLQLDSVNHLVDLGIRPGYLSSWKGIFFMPLLHDPDSVKHILNNSIPAFFLLAALIFHYRSIALPVFVISWLGTGLIVWLFPENHGGYHIGFSGIIYALFGFLLISGFFKKSKSLQGLTLAVSFVYGSMIWGMFPIEEKISWEGHLGGFIVGVILAVFYRKHGPIPPKFQYEIEKELGIEPPDLEGIWRENQEAYWRQQEALEEMKRLQEQQPFIQYHYMPKKTDNPRVEKLPDDTEG